MLFVVAVVAVFKALSYLNSVGGAVIIPLLYFSSRFLALVHVRIIRDLKRVKTKTSRRE